MDSEIKVSFYEKPDTKCELEYAVIAARKDGKWLYVRHRERDTWEIPGGHIEKGESYIDAAHRELKEESGAVEYTLSPVSFYSVKIGDMVSNGALFLADIEKLDFRGEYETAEIAFFTSLPDKLTYPAIQPQLFFAVQGWLNVQSNSGELWDIYDEKRRLTGKTHRRGEAMACGDYHIVVGVWIRDKSGKLLITKRAANKGFPNMWENTGGSALAGDDSISAAIREVKEETGLDLLPENGRLILTTKSEHDFNDIWLFEQEIDLSNVVLQDMETVDARLASSDEILAMIAAGEFVPIHYLNDFIRLIHCSV